MCTRPLLLPVWTSILWLSILIVAAQAFNPLHSNAQKGNKRHQRFHERPTIRSKDDTATFVGATSTTTSSFSSPLLTGVTELEAWLVQESPAATINPNVEHAVFLPNPTPKNSDAVAVRGLKWKNPRALVDNNDKGKAIALACSIPVDKVMRSDYDSTSTSWDVDLACQLWNEVMKGRSSPYWGYVQFLTSSSSSPTGAASTYGSASPGAVLPSLAPHAIRHWTSNQLELLQQAPAGQKLLNLHQQQESLWRKKYHEFVAKSDSTISTDILSWDQFVWAMEVVHSRAYLGASVGVTSEPSSQVLASLAAPVVAAIVGLLYSFTTPEPSVVILAALAITAALPFAINSGKSTSYQSATLLPLIDSANHCVNADSSIRYNPLRRCFELQIRPRCIDPNTHQLFVSYGQKSDTELLLNYGFVPNAMDAFVSEFPTFEDGRTTDDVVREILARKFLERNAM